MVSCVRPVLSNPSDWEQHLDAEKVATYLQDIPCTRMVATYKVAIYKTPTYEIFHAHPREMWHRQPKNLYSQRNQNESSRIRSARLKFLVWRLPQSWRGGEIVQSGLAQLIVSPSTCHDPCQNPGAHCRERDDSPCAASRQREPHQHLCQHRLRCTKGEVNLHPFTIEDIVLFTEIFHMRGLA